MCWVECSAIYLQNTSFSSSLGQMLGLPIVLRNDVVFGGDHGHSVRVLLVLKEPKKKFNAMKGTMDLEEYKLKLSVANFG